MANIEDKYDVVVAGAGMGGLTCGALLAKNKKSVLVIDRRSQPGGYCSSFEHRGYIFDMGLAYLTGCELGGIIYQALDELELRDGIDFIRVRPSIRVLGSDYDLRISSVEALEDGLTQLFPMETLAIRQFIGECKAVAAEMQDLSARKSPDLSNTWQKISLTMLSLFKHRRALVYGRRSWQQVVDGFFEDPKLRAIVLSIFPCYEPGTMARLPMMESGSREDFCYPRRGAQALADLLADGLTRYGGDLALDTAAEAILIEGGKAVGVKLGDGREVKAHHVVSNADARQTFLGLVGEQHLSSRFAAKLNQTPLSGSAFVVSLGVSLNLKAMGFDGASIVYNPSDDIEELFGSDPAKCKVTINIHSILEPSQAPDSTSAVQLMAVFPYDLVQDWQAEQDGIADKLIATAEKVIPRLSGHILCRHVNSPFGLEQSTANSQGAILGWYPAPRSRTRSQRTPIKNLYQVGQWTYTGGGVPAAIASGRNAAQLVLKSK
jgi:all-trans-retinol 13,14-reductase